MADYSRTHRWLAMVAAALGGLAIVAEEPYPAGRNAAHAGKSGFLTAIDVARVVRDRRAGVRIVDLRADSLFDAYHIPGAERIDRADIPGVGWSTDDTVVVYADDDATAIDAAGELYRRRVRHVRVLRGGLHSWVDQIVQPRLGTLAPTATADEQAARREQLELSRYFGGTPYVSPEVSSQPDRRSEAAAVARILRRGC